MSRSRNVPGGLVTSLLVLAPLLGACPDFVAPYSDGVQPETDLQVRAEVSSDVNLSSEDREYLSFCQAFLESCPGHPERFRFETEAACLQLHTRLSSSLTNPQRDAAGLPEGDTLACRYAWLTERLDSVTQDQICDNASLDSSESCTEP
ncbi:MAG: hypothetical protein KC561_11920 [Myxococcales bacterium]|nr:hypothetical protein [Myxococcales bacterium]